MVSMQGSVSSGEGARGGGGLHMKGVGMLIVSLRGVNFRSWSHLGCSGENIIIVVKALFRLSHEL